MIELNNVKLGLFLVLCGLVFGIVLGIAFGASEDGFKTYIADGIAAHPQIHDAKSNGKIWRYVQRAHFHATGVSAFSLGLIIVITGCTMTPLMKKVSSTLIGLGSLYPLSWFVMFVLAPDLGRDSAHHHMLTEVLVYVGVGGLTLGIAMIILNIFLGLFKKPSTVLH